MPRSATAHAIVEISIVNPRIVTNFMETRAAVCEYDARRDHLTLTVGSQGSHRIREIIGGMVLKIPPEKIRVICPDVGGGFGTKLFPVPRICACSRSPRASLRKTVKWTADRADHFMGDAQGRDNATTARMALARTASSSAWMSISSATWARICRPSARTSRMAAPACCRAFTTSRLSTAACARSSPTPCRSMPIAAPDVLRRPTCSSAWSMRPRASST